MSWKYKVRYARRLDPDMGQTGQTGDSGQRDGPATRVYKVRPHHVRQESIAIRTAILEERVVSGIKT